MPAYKPGSEIKKLIEEIHRAQARTSPVTLNLKLIISFEELRALIKYVDWNLAGRWKSPDETEQERVLLDAMEALAAALPH